MIAQGFLGLTFAIAVPIAMLSASLIGGVRLSGWRKIIFAACLTIAISSGLVLLATLGFGVLWPDVLYQGEWMTTPDLFKRVITIVALSCLGTNSLALYLFASAWKTKTR